MICIERFLSRQKVSNHFQVHITSKYAPNTADLEQSVQTAISTFAATFTAVKPRVFVRCARAQRRGSMLDADFKLENVRMRMGVTGLLLFEVIMRFFMSLIA